MASWDSLSIRIDPFGPLRPPIKSVLTVLETVEALLEALLDIVRAFSIDFLNPLKAVVALILAAIRTIINQLKSTGFSILLVHPDFSQPDFGAVIHSVSGAYPKFESKVVAKFFDTSDVFRPSYPEGSSVAMFVFYIGSDSPGDLISQLFALLRFLRHPQILSGLPAPVNLKARPVNQSGAAISQFKKLFDSDLDKAVQLEWQMPMAPTGGNAPGFVNSLVSYYNSFKFPNFVVERSTEPLGETVTQELKTSTIGKGTKTFQQRLKFASPESSVVVREPSGLPLRNFKEKFPITSVTGLSEGYLSGTYRYLDKNFSEDDRGKTFYYRVRAYFGEPTTYLESGQPSDYQAMSKPDGRNKVIYDFGDGVVMGNPSPVVQGFVPRARPGGSQGVFNLYEDIYRAVQVALLLNFEFPPAVATDSPEVRDQKSGWGTLSMIAGQIGPLKSSFKNSNTLKDAFLFKTASRRIANQCSSVLFSNPALADLVAEKWVSGGIDAVYAVEGETVLQWGFVGITGGYTSGAREKISGYLASESSYQNGAPQTNGPYPLARLSAERRAALADFLRVALSPLSGQSKYLSWYSVTIGDIFPAFIPFIYDFEQFILALLKAVEGALTEIEDIIQTLISKIQQLEAILQTIDALIALLKINVSVSLLATSSTNGSAQSLARALIDSDQKPASSPFGLHSGMVLTAGGPGQGSIAALKAIAFLLQIPI